MVELKSMSLSTSNPGNELPNPSQGKCQDFFTVDEDSKFSIFDRSEVLQ